MRKTASMLACGLSAAIVLAAGSAIVAAPEQIRPGEMTRGEVWIQNRGKTEAVPVSIQDVASVQVTGIPVVQVSGTPTVAIAPASVVQTRGSRQEWEYKVVTINAAGSELSALTNAGRDGWETTGVQLTAPAGTGVLLKRPR